LAKIFVPESIINTGDEFDLHPTLLDSALQASIGFMMNDRDKTGLESGLPSTPSIPFALEELRIYSRCRNRMWAFIRNSSQKPGDKIRKLDVDICDENGNICISLMGFSSRMLEGETHRTSGLCCLNHSGTKRMFSTKMPVFITMSIWYCSVARVVLQ
jgi:acyl transferase domain-containing protein